MYSTSHTTQILIEMIVIFYGPVPFIVLNYCFRYEVNKLEMLDPRSRSKSDLNKLDKKDNDSSFVKN